MVAIIDCYRKVGLHSEADGITKAVDAWFETGGNDKKFGEAYRSVPNEYTTDFDRWDYLSDYFVKNSNKLFYCQGNK